MSDTNVRTTTIRQTIEFEASPERVYDAYMQSKQHAEFTGARAEIEPEVGGHFSAYEGYAVGEFTELEPGKRIACTWKEDSPEWPAGHYTTVTMDLRAHEGGTELEFTQEGVPIDREDDIAAGWEDWYWDPLTEYLGG